MNSPIIFTPQDFFSALLAICGAISVVAGATAVIVKMVASIVIAIKKPNAVQDEKIEQLQKDMAELKAEIKGIIDRHNKLQESNDKRLDAIEEAGAITQRAILALLSHAINGNDKDALYKAKDDLADYLTHIHKK